MEPVVRNDDTWRFVRKAQRTLLMGIISTVLALGAGAGLDAVQDAGEAQAQGIINTGPRR